MVEIICDNPLCENSKDEHCTLQNVKLEGIGTDDEFCDGFKFIDRTKILICICCGKSINEHDYIYDGKCSDCRDKKE